jgi:hypothetical protein
MIVGCRDRLLGKVYTAEETDGTGWGPQVSHLLTLALRLDRLVRAAAVVAWTICRWSGAA